MASKIPVPEVSWSEVNVSLGGQEYKITYTFNERDERWRFDLEDIILGVKVMENQELTGRYLLEGLGQGDIYCIRYKRDGLDVGFSNLGIDDPYELVFLSNSEIEELGV